MQILSYTLILIGILSVIVSLINVKMMFRIRKHGNNLRAKVYDKYKVIVLCGSTRFKSEFEMINKELTLRGHIVISVGCFGHSSDKEVINDNTKKMLDKLHKRKIDLASAIMVINKDGYIGESTKSEIEYAKSTNKEIYYWYN
jgi:hypothetical protein